MVSKIKTLCKENKISILKLETELGFGNGTIGKWKTHTPAHDKLKKVADFFGVSIEYLIGESEQKEKAPIVSDEDLRLAEFNRLFTSLPPDVQARELAYLRELANNSNK